MPPTRKSSTVHHMLRTTTACIIAVAKLAAVACVLTLLISGSSFLRGSHAGRDDLLGRSFSMVSTPPLEGTTDASATKFFGIAAKDAGTALPYLAKMHWFINSFGWEWLETTTEVDGVGYVFNQPVRPLHMPATLHDVAHSLERAGHITTKCQSATETCIGLSSAFFGAFDAASSLALNNAPAFVFYTLAIIFDIMAPTVFACIGLFRVEGSRAQWPRLKTFLLILPVVFHLIAASVLTSNATLLVAYLNQFPDVPAEAVVGRCFLAVAWCGFAVEVAASAASIVRAFPMWLPSHDDDPETETSRQKMPIKSRKPADQD
ncbi:hypothetical protein ColLi_06236 [Colletotrichum liriopes]|uniref:Uncharacterized protein n=1 Tax=Colletotrichum liriopes TaxID=708192 RepID=A0AA37LTH4_9PEZI|nr:hypothetical protein ColLi_06236 [Colletotrichum liriopes]